MRTGAQTTSVLVLVLIGLLLSACASTAPVSDSSPETLYQAAIEDAKTAEPPEIVTTLTPLVPHNDDPIWRAPSEGEPQVLAVTWTDSTSSVDASPGDTLTTEENIWVTAAPEIRQFCEALDETGEQLALRLAQRLGLPPDVNYDHFVALWVRPDDLVRPCPDPEVTDRECELDTPTPEEHVQVSDAHREWIRDLEDSMYGPDGYPWTRLGYTYDWNPNTDEVGLSEFVIRPGAKTEIRAVEETDSYCGTK